MTAVIAFPAHFYVLAPVASGWIRAQLPPGDYRAPLGARFLVALADRIGAHIGASDAVLAARAHGSDGAGCVVPGRGLARRWEVSYEAEPAARGRGLGRALATAALGLLPAGTPVFAQVAPGNSVSLRATLAAGYRPIGGEVLLPTVPPRRQTAAGALPPPGP